MLSLVELDFYIKFDLKCGQIWSNSTMLGQILVK